MQSLFNAKAKLSVMVNGLLVPFSRVPDACKRFARPLAFYNDGSSYEVSIVGSATMIREAGTNYLIATKHQLGEPGHRREPTEVIVMVPEVTRSGMMVVTPSGSIDVSFDQSGMEFAEDLLILTFTRGPDRPEFNLRFVDINGFPSVRDADIRELVATFTIGYPSDAVSYNLHDDGSALSDINSKFSVLYLEGYDNPHREQFHFSLKVKEEVPVERVLDGYSGAPVFSIFLNSQGHAGIAFVGVVRNGGNNTFQVYDGGQIRHMIRQFNESAKAGSDPVEDGPT